MKKLLLILFSSACSCLCFGQSADSVLARIYYKYSNLNDTLKTGKTRTENMLLFLGKNSSLYTSFDKIRYAVSEDQRSQARAMNVTGSAPKMIQVDRSASEWLTQANYTFLNLDKKLFVKEEIMGMGYLIEEKIPEIVWEITKDTLSFSGLACQKATTRFEGKTWTAWFAPNLPFQSGPWKLHGLPGLIVEARSEDETVKFEFSGFEVANEAEFVRLNDIRKRAGSQPGDISPVDVLMGLDVSSAYFDNIIKFSTYRTTKTTRKAFEELKARYLKDPAGFRKAQWGF